MTNETNTQVEAEVEIDPQAAAYAVGHGITVFPDNREHAHRAAVVYLAQTTPRPEGTRAPLRAAERAVDLAAQNRAQFAGLDDPWAPIFDDVPRPREVRLTMLAQWIVSLDDVEGPGAQARRTITLTKLINAAREALGTPTA
jgi:hypothetical protein